ncbi:MAG: DNA primase [Rhodobiaceae bacterium]|nr:DNA primase [Rhodobiaceae bacterium]
MSFPKSFLDELKARIRVSEIVGRQVKLTRRGREFVGLSPFNNEKTPSFTVNDDKQFYHCFSTGEHGDAIKFLEKTENLSFMEAVERLAGEAGMEVPKMDPKSAEREKKKAGLIDVSEMAQSYFVESLKRGKGAEAHVYLVRRGLSEETISLFGLGYAPDSRTGMKDYLQGRSVRVPQMIESGVLIGGDDIPQPYDRFRNRVTFPIEDQRGRVIAFGGRALDPNARAKYLNSPETPLFHKGATLYNFARARKPAYDIGTVIVAEGYMDVIALHQGGFPHAVAPLGTALTEEQIQLLWRMTSEPILCFDGDRAGRKAAYRAVERVLPLLKPGHSLRFAMLPDGKDPDDLIRDGGSGAMQEVLDQAKPLSTMLWDWQVSLGEWDTPERRAAFEEAMGELVASIADPKVRGHYREGVRSQFRAYFGSEMPEDLGEARPSSSRPSSGRASSGGGQGYDAPYPDYDDRGGYGDRGATRGSQGFKKGFGGAFRDGGQKGSDGSNNVPYSAGRGKKDKFGRKRKGFGELLPVPVTSKLLENGLVRGEAEGQNREALLILTLLNHPELLDDFGEELAVFEFGDRKLDKIRNEIIDIAALIVPLDRGVLEDHLNSRGFSETARSLASLPALKSDRFAWPDATLEAAKQGWLHLWERHKYVLTLQRELKAAVNALAEAGSETPVDETVMKKSFERLQALQIEIGALEVNGLNKD